MIGTWIAVGGLALVALGAALLFARESRQVWTLFAAALVFALIAVLGYVAATSPSTVHWTKAVIPVVVIVGAIGMTQIYPGRARAKARDTRG